MVERLTVDRVDVEVGGRYDRMGRTAFLPRADYELHLRRETLEEGDCAQRETVAASVQRPTALGRSVLEDWSTSCPTSSILKLNLSSASRFPNVDELYLIGSAPSFPVYAVGDPGLRTETA